MKEEKEKTKYSNPGYILIVIDSSLISLNEILIYQSTSYFFQCNFHCMVVLFYISVACTLIFLCVNAGSISQASDHHELDEWEQSLIPLVIKRSVCPLLL